MMMSQEVSREVRRRVAQAINSDASFVLLLIERNEQGAIRGFHTIAKDMTPLEVQTVVQAVKITPHGRDDGPIES